jgi:hypothetical protein
MGVLARPSTQLKINDRAEYWDERRRWWAHHKIGAGTDWVGVAKTILDVDQYLNGNDAAVVRDDYDGLSSTFARACRQADAERRNPRPRAHKDSLPTSTGKAVDWLLKFGDERRLRNFLEGRSEAELERIERYIAWKKQQ